MLDSTQADVLEAGLKRLGGRAIVNSINLEDGEARMDAVCPMARQYGAALVALLIDEEGQARDVDWKLRIAHRIHDLAIDKHGLAPRTWCSTPSPSRSGPGRRTCAATPSPPWRRSGASRPSCPGSGPSSGVSNVSFGLAPAARQVLNSVFLHEAREAGLDAAIVAPARILPMHRIDDEQRQVALDLIYDRRRDGYDPLQKFMALFEGKEVAKAASAEDLAALPIDERLQRRIVDGGPRRAWRPTWPRPCRPAARLSIINEVLLAGMKTVGELFGAGEMQLPFVLQSAEVMKAAVAVLEPHMEKADQGGKGRVVPGHGQGRRPRHRQEPGRHHPHQQRLHGPQHRHQAADRDHHREGRGGRGRRHRHVRAAGQVDHRDARQPGGAERPRPGRLPGAAGRGGPEPHLCRGRPAPALQGRVFYCRDAFAGPAGHGPAAARARAGRPGRQGAGAGAPGRPGPAARPRPGPARHRRAGPLGRGHRRARAHRARSWARPGWSRASRSATWCPT
jgi:5-methyltetrahydrofolate--homocysteine methyltransferase